METESEIERESERDERDRKTAKHTNRSNDIHSHIFERHARDAIHTRSGSVTDSTHTPKNKRNCPFILPRLKSSRLHILGRSIYIASMVTKMCVFFFFFFFFISSALLCFAFLFDLFHTKIISLRDFSRCS